jgi:hypothetical protein
MEAGTCAGKKLCWSLRLVCENSFYCGTRVVPTNVLYSSWRVSWESPAHCTLRAGKNPWISSSGSSTMSTTLPFLKGLFGRGTSRSLERVGPKMDVCNHRFVTSRKVITHSFVSTKSNCHQDDGSRNMCFFSTRASSKLFLDASYHPVLDYELFWQTIIVYESGLLWKGGSTN